MPDSSAAPPESPATAQNIPAAPDSAPSNTTEWLGSALGLLSIRIWLGIRTFVAGIEKFAGSKASETAVAIDGEPNVYGLTEASSDKVYSLANYQGVPAALRSRFEAEPLMPGFFLNIYDIVLGPALLLLGLTVLLGILPRISLFAMGLLYTSLTIGLVMIKQDAGVAWLGTHMILIGIALVFSDRDRFAIWGKKC